MNLRPDSENNLAVEKHSGVADVPEQTYMILASRTDGERKHSEAAGGAALMSKQYSVALQVLCNWHGCCHVHPL
jgi:hypothetical protein